MLPNNIRAWSTYCLNIYFSEKKHIAFCKINNLEHTTLAQLHKYITFFAKNKYLLRYTYRQIMQNQLFLRPQRTHEHSY